MPFLFYVWSKFSWITRIRRPLYGEGLQRMLVVAHTGAFGGWHGHPFWMGASPGVEPGASALASPGEDDSRPSGGARLPFGVAPYQRGCQWMDRLW